MDKRLENLNRFASGLLDINLSRNPLSQEALLIFNDVHRDHYQDAVISEECRLKKRVLLKKDTDLNYLQEFGEVLVEDVDSLPWIVSITMTGLPRQPKMDDQIVLSGRKYTISMVKPVNRNVDSILLLMIYPERSEPFEELGILSLVIRSIGGKDVLDIVYTGDPKEYSLDGINWLPFESYIISPNPVDVVTLECGGDEVKRTLIDNGFSEDTVLTVYESLYNRKYLWLRDKYGIVVNKEVV